MKTRLLFIFCIGLALNLSAQRNLKDSIIGTPWVSVQYGFNFCEGDLKDRYGHFNHIGFFAGYKTKRNWVFGIDANYMFGNKINLTGILDHLADSDGYITDQNGDQALVLLYNRGVHANATAGKVFPVLSPNKNSGIYVNFGAGYLLHKLRVETQEHVVPQIELDYKKGYDRLTTGINTSQFIGYSYMANQGFLNFYAGFYFQQGFTYNRRTIFFDRPEIEVPSDLRFDLQYGFRVGWLIPVYKRQPKEFYYN